MTNCLSDVEETRGGYVCSPQTTIVASVVIVVVLFVGMLSAFTAFYRYKRRQWTRKVNYSSSGRGRSSQVVPTICAGASREQPPPVPARPATASGALGVSGARHTVQPEASSPKPGSADSNRVLYVNPYKNNQPQPGISRQRIQALNASNTSLH